MKKPENFTLKNVKKMKNGGLQGKISYTKQEGGVTHTEEWDFKNTDNPHPDLVERLDQLKAHLANFYDIDSMVILSNSKGLKIKDEDAFKQLKKFIDGSYQETLKKIDINGVAISGEKDDDKDNRSVVIMGAKLMENGSKAALNSPSVKLSQDTFQNEADIQEIVNELCEEVEAYLYEGKRAQLEMFHDEAMKVA